MFREMRRKQQLLSAEETIEIFEKGTSGTLALLGDDDYPYAVPVSYVYSEGKLFFHGAKEGHKIDAIQKSEKASFCVIDEDEVVPEKYTTNYRSAIAFGKIRIIEEDYLKRLAMEKLVEKYSPDSEDKQKTIENAYAHFCMIEFKVEHMTGKAARK